jgi:hypothetical protein
MMQQSQDLARREIRFPAAKMAKSRRGIGGWVRGGPLSFSTSRGARGGVLSLTLDVDARQIRQALRMKTGIKGRWRSPFCLNAFSTADKSAQSA